MATHKQVAAMRAADQRASDRYLRSLGYQSKIFLARGGGTCNGCMHTLRAGAKVAYFQDALHHTTCIDQAIRERDACKTCKGAHVIIQAGVAQGCPACNPDKVGN